jgi:hypothetical protein
MLSLLLIFLSGMCEGVMDTISFHYRRFKAKHKKAKDLFWDPEYSWLNKYNSGMKPKFFGSTTFLVFATDGWHLMKWLRNTLLFSSIGFALYYTLDFRFAILLYMINRLGFVTVYNGIYK